jgi:DNA-binding response OmpR family regulator
VAENGQCADFYAGSAMPGDEAMLKLLLIEDHREIANIIFEYLEMKGHSLDWAADGIHGLNLAHKGHYDVIVLDIMLPHLDGLSVCRQLRDEGNDTPILMLTARDQNEDILAGYEHGTDGYLVKPFDLKVLEARIHALHRRHMGSMALKNLEFGALKLDVANHIVHREGLEIQLNKTLFIILKTLMLRAPDVTTREELISEIWDDDEPDHDVLRSHIYLLRSHIDKPFDYSYIRTVPKVGYQLVEAPGQ